MDVNGGKSKRRKIPVGVFQGSIAGPILFIIFSDDLVTLEDATTKISIYTDDNNYKLKLGNDVEENKLLINRKLKEVETYMNANKLKFNVKNITESATLNSSGYLHIVLQSSSIIMLAVVVGSEINRTRNVQRTMRNTTHSEQSSEMKLARKVNCEHVIKFRR